MSDIDDDLLALAGIGSDDDVQESEDDYEPEVSKSKSSGNKRKIQDSDDEDEDDDEDEGEKDPYPLEGKFKDANDRDELMGMDEMTREQILFDRIQEMQKYRERKYLALRARQSRVENTLKDSTANKKKALRTNKLSELKKQREKKSRGTSRRSRDESEDEADEDDEDDGLMSVDDEDDYDEGYYSDTADSRRTRSKRQTVEDGIDYTKPATLSDINTRIRVGRSALAKFLYRDEFPTVIAGTFARLNIGFSREQNRNQYRLCKVEEVKRDTAKPYTLMGKPCNSFLLVSQGTSQKLTDLNCVSDSLITEDEFAIYKKRVEEADQLMPTVGDVDYKYRELKEMSTRKLTDEDINKMVQARDTVSAKTMEAGNRVRRLQIAREELEVAISKNDMAEIKRIQETIDEFNKYTNRNKEESSLTKVNLRNRRTNDNLIRKAEKHAVEGRKQQLLSSAVNSDPFSRLRTSTKMFYSASAAQSDGKSEEAIKANDLSAEEALRIKAEKREQERKSMISSKYRKFGIDSVIKDIPFDIQIDA